MASAKIKVPETAKKGEVIEIKTSITHDMESGQRKDANDKPIPRRIINTFTCKYNGTEVFRMDLHPAVSANPYISFFVVATETGKIEMFWNDDNGEIYTAASSITVS
ncbi:thiosulfate oxidation carrier complex protein SoxZ [Paramagnetospirillum kuznetsovii]|uniref:Thiosulfate oxidation carrier complex protein SoxZ n=1 Tax=Paramagnetospirillum kuznetsovii TaxID=2053833 RepID=A0A364NU97_9PROT|nr:thiosulfate oxidation carrier complex protein SoxZ [Paramagnetospirillum kuznetsovii]RAU20580.1 thiosulfate oxidation carrier complex protein SoxZ [Paramagnetospirillum kuznetsovii]